MTREELGAALAGARIDPSGQRLPHVLLHCELEAVVCSAGLRGQRLPHVLLHCELEAVVCSAGLRGKQQTYGLLDERVAPLSVPFDREAAAIELTVRYLASHGPAAVQDLAWWSSLAVADIRAAL